MKLKGAMGVLKRNREHLGFETLESQIAFYKKHTLNAASTKVAEALEIFKKANLGYHVHKNAIIKWGDNSEAQGIKITELLGERENV